MPKITLHGRVLDRLGTEIAGGRHPPGTILRIEDLEKRFTASRTVVREVIRVLESMQLVASRRRVGITVQDRSRWNVYDPRIIRWRLSGPDRSRHLLSLNELRRAIEPLAAAAAAERADSSQRQDLIGLGDELRRSGRAGDMDAFIAADIAFHRLILEASDNEMFTALAETIAEVVSDLTVYTLIPRRPSSMSLKLHGQAAHAIHAGEANRAEAAIRSLIDGSRRQIQRALARSSDH